MLSFYALPAKTGCHYEDGNLAVYSLHGNGRLPMNQGGTYYVFVGKGIAIYDDAFFVPEGFYGAFTEGCLKTKAATEAMVVHMKNYHGIMQFSGPVEDRGRLRYIDGCTDTCLIAPFRKGDPCLNYLHFPKGVKQTPHTHPDLRIGYVWRGQGRCVTPWGNTPLGAGMQFMIMPANGKRELGLDDEYHAFGTHCFHTEAHEMGIVALHPTSDFGPTDEAHPMILQTHLV